MTNLSMDTDISDVFKGSGKKIKPIIAGLVLVIVVGILLTNSVQFVPAGYKGVLLHWNAVDGVSERDGQFISVKPPLEEGIHFVVPFQDHIVPVEVRTQKVDTQATGASKDLQDVNTSVALNFHIAPESVHIVWKQIGGDYNIRIIQPAVEETVKKVTAKFNAEELVTKREFAKAEIEKELRARLIQYNLVLEQTSITNFQFSQEFTNSIEAKVVAEQQAQQAVNVLKRIQVEAQQAQAKAEGEAFANIAKANGEAQAIKTINDALTSNPNYLEWLKTQKWNGELPKVTGGAVPFIQIPMEGQP